VCACGLASGCASPVADTLYQPVVLTVATPAWTGRAPELVRTAVRDGVPPLAGWHWPSSTTDGAVLVYLPGRTGNRDIAARRAQAFAEGGQAVLVASYRGYGDNPGRPSEQALYEDGLAFVRLARQLHPTGRLFVFGDGLGAAVALHVAAEAPNDAPIDAVVTLGAFDRFGSFAPKLTRPFYADAFDNVAAIRRVRVPVLLMHGAKDEVVPFAAAETLRAAAGGKAVVVPVAGEAFHALDLRYIAPVVWRALDHVVDTPAR
jgi:fermentation-respiration switch protein FrsA (DUF1100 family)